MFEKIILFSNALFSLVNHIKCHKPHKIWKSNFYSIDIQFNLAFWELRTFLHKHKNKRLSSLYMHFLLVMYPFYSTHLEPNLLNTTGKRQAAMQRKHAKLKILAHHSKELDLLLVTDHHPTPAVQHLHLTRLLLS